MKAQSEQRSPVKRSARFKSRVIREGTTTTLMLRPEPYVRKRTNANRDLVSYYSADGEVVRIDLLNDVPAPPSTGLFMGMRTAAELLGTNASTTRRAAARGTLRALNVNGEWLTTPEWVEEYKSNRRGPGRPRKSA